jgi:hypothetical protein
LIFRNEDHDMSKLIVGILALGLVVVAPVSAHAFIPAQSGIPVAADAVSSDLEVKGGRGKGKHKGWKKHRFGHPPGWSRGRKVGWGGRGMPPGQAKKYW